MLNVCLLVRPISRGPFRGCEKKCTEHQGSPTGPNLREFRVTPQGWRRCARIDRRTGLEMIYADGTPTAGAEWLHSSFASSGRAESSFATT